MSKPSADHLALMQRVRESTGLEIGPPLRAANLERPERGEVTGDLVFAGWILGSEGPVAAVAAGVSGRALGGWVPVDRERPDIEAAFERFDHARRTGFRLRLPAALVPRAGAIELTARMVSGAEVPFWRVELGDPAPPEPRPPSSRRWLRARRVPAAEPRAATIGAPGAATETVTGPDLPAALRACPLRIIALIAAYNEADIIEPVIAHLAENGIWSYLIDNGSSDETVARATRQLGRGLLGVDTLANPEHGRTSWRSILARKLELARELGADWYIHHDADEFRESPWPSTTLGEAIVTVDRLGYNAIDFRVCNFPPVDDTFRAGDDPRAHFLRWEGPAEYDRVQRKCWRAVDAEVRLEDGGHDVSFPGRRVFPLRFLLRHYPIRSQAHGHRKVIHDRRDRFVAEEVQYGWHRQYDHVSGPEHLFLRNPAELHPFDLDRLRIETMLEDTGGEPSTAPEPPQTQPEDDEQGVLDRVSETIISGWAVRDGDDRPLEIDIWDGGRLLATVPADQPRPDLAERGIGSGAGGFRLRTPRELSDGRPHWIWATVAGSGTPLGRSPLALHSAGRVAIGAPDREAPKLEVV